MESHLYELYFQTILIPLQINHSLPLFTNESYLNLTILQNSIISTLSTTKPLLFVPNLPPKEKHFRRGYI